MSPPERWLQELIAAARAQKVADSTIGDDLQTVVEVAEVLARMLAITVLDGPPMLATVRATLNSDRSSLPGLLSARPAMAPALIGEPPTRELDTRIEIVDEEDRLVGDVRFVWIAG
jgi:hypothetical protein